jgi:hypothetical protein
VAKNLSCRRNENGWRRHDGWRRRRSKRRKPVSGWLADASAAKTRQIIAQLKIWRKMAAPIGIGGEENRNSAKNIGGGLSKPWRRKK